VFQKLRQFSQSFQDASSRDLASVEKLAGGPLAESDLCHISM
jgi:hypothetical protein